MMKSRQAKDFLVQQASEQAALEGVPLSDLEKRMMYFTESDSSCENPAALNEEFEAEYDTDEYETKVSELLHHAYERLKKEDPENVRNWDQSIQTLRKGDHYILVLCDDNPSREPATAHSVTDSLKLLGAGLLLATVFLVVAFLAAKYDISWDPFPQISSCPKPGTLGQICGWVSGEFDFHVLRASDEKDVLWRHVDVSELDQLEEAYAEFLRTLQNPAESR